ncbi:hypothetical protein HMI56_001185 [Coelomomyces lativittatus]|nr:hypothetical protein HMI56_001185 [Coelomomyces lativittatus]
MKAPLASYHLQCSSTPRSMHLTSDLVNCILHHRIDDHMVSHSNFHSSRNYLKKFQGSLKKRGVNLDCFQFDRIFYEFNGILSYKFRSAPKNIEKKIISPPTQNIEELIDEPLQYVEENESLDNFSLTTTTLHNSPFPNGQITVVSLYNFLGDCFPTLRLQKIAFPYLAFVMYICISFWLLVQAESSYWTQLLPFLMPLYPICVFVKLWNYFVISIVLICMPIFFTIPPSESISEEITVLECILLSNQDELSFIEGLSQFVYTSPQKCEALVEFTILYFWFRELHGTMNLAKCVALVLYLEQRNLT